MSLNVFHFIHFTVYVTDCVFCGGKRDLVLSEVFLTPNVNDKQKNKLQKGSESCYLSGVFHDFS